MKLNVGDKIDNRYQILESLGEGGMGKVYKVRDTELQTIAAVKILHHDLHDRQTARFVREARALAQMNNDKIVRVFRLGETKSFFYIVMEYLQGEPLSKLVEAHTHLAPERAIQIVIQVCDAMDYSHRAGILHRDLKPSNILLRAGSIPEEVVVIDFGLAFLSKSAHQASTLTSPGEVLGSPHFMSPEQFAGQADQSSDIYALGCILYNLLTGAPPFQSNNIFGLRYQHVANDPEPLRSHMTPPIPIGLQSVIDKCLAKDRSMRYASMSEVRSDLILVQSGQGNLILPKTKTRFRLAGLLRALLLLGCPLAVVLSYAYSNRIIKDSEAAEDFKRAASLTQRAGIDGAPAFREHAEEKESIEPVHDAISRSEEQAILSKHEYVLLDEFRWQWTHVRTRDDNSRLEKWLTELIPRIEKEEAFLEVLSRSRIKLAELLMSRDQYSAALNQLDKTTEATNWSIELMALKFKCLCYLGKKVEARALLAETIVLAERRNCEADFRKACALCFDCDYLSEALYLNSKAVETSEHNDEVLTENLLWRLRIWNKLHQFEEVFSAAEQRLAENPLPDVITASNIWMELELADIQGCLNRSDVAAKLFERLFIGTKSHFHISTRGTVQPCLSALTTVAAAALKKKDHRTARKMLGLVYKIGNRENWRGDSLIKGILLAMAVQSRAIRDTESANFFEELAGVFKKN